MNVQLTRILSEPRRCTCQHCNYNWYSRVAMPRQCPNCKRQDWRSKDENLESTAS